jgi:endoglucanase
MSHLRSFVLKITTVLFLTILIQQAQAQVQTAKPGVSMCSNSNGYYEYLPQGYNNSNQTYPLLIFVHGIGELGNGTSQLSSLMVTGVASAINAGQFPATFNVNGQSFSFIVISPQFVAWPSPNDINAVIDYAVSHYRVNTSRIYLTGLSMGGGAVWEYAGNNTTYANRIAALVPIAGASWPDYGRARTMAAANLPVWALHNDGDPTVPVSYTNDYVSQINQAPSPNPLAVKTIFSSGSHDAWTNVYNSRYRDGNGRSVYEWMLQYSKGGNTGTVNKVPTANAGGNQTVTLPTNSITVYGSGSDQDGSISMYQWSEVYGPNNATFSNAYSATCTLGNLIQGTYTFRLTVTDNSGATATSDINVTVNASAAITYASVPGKIEAENYSAQNGIQTENTADAGGGKNVGWQDNNDWMDYPVNVSAAGTYSVDFRVATPNNGTQFQVRKQDGTVLATVNAPNTGGWQNWQTTTANVTLAAGQQTLRIYTNNAAGGWNLNWINFSTASAAIPAPTPAPSGTIHIEAENFTSQYGIQTENTGDAGGGLNVGWQENGDWMDYSANVPSAGTYTVNFRVATANTGVQFQLRNSSGSVLATVTAPNTGWWQTYQTVSAAVTLPAGQQTLRIYTADAKGTGWNINWFDLVSGGASTTPPPTTSGSSIHIEAENFTSQYGIQTEATQDAGGGQNVGWQDNGDWMDYSANLSSAGTYTMNFRVASYFGGGQFQVKNSAGNVLATVNIPKTGNYQTWQTISASVTFPAGQQTLRIYTVNSGGGWNINWFDILGAGGGSATQTPSSSIHIEAENLIMQSGIQTENTQDAGGGLNVGWQDNNDWMDYSVNVASAGTYTVNFRVATPNAGGNFQLRNSGGTALATVTLPNTGGWQTWQTISASVTLPAGQQTLRIYTVNSGGGWTINWFDILTSGSTSTVKIAAKDTAVLSETPQAAVQLFPNPVKDRFALKVTNELKGQMKVTISNMAGQVVKQLTVQKPQTGTTQSYLSAGDLAKGQYIITLTMSNWTETTKMIKE